MSVDVLLSTYDGAAYLDAQLDSLEAQTDRDWRVLARDDGSTDATPRLLAARRAAWGGRLEIVDGSGERLGPAASFARLMEASTAPYALFCDQDDVWLPEKIARSRAAMRTLEEAHGADVPLLVHTDLRVVDAALGVLASSFWRAEGIDPSRAGLGRLLLRNVVTGCTVLLNAPLRRRAVPVPADAFLHDWWVALVASASGHLARIDEPTLLYRRHGANVVGARSALRRAGDVIRRPGRVRRYYARALRQARAFADAHASALSASERAALEEALARWERGPLSRAVAVARGTLREQGVLRNLAFVCCG